MNRRPYLTHKQRPLSAIFIGSLDSNSAPSTPELPVLPSSPSTSSNGSGLPSPPATNSTNSTGSGEGSTNGSLRRKTVRSEAGSSMLNGSFNKSQTSFKSRATNFSDDEDDHHDHENDEDTTARFNTERRRSSLTSVPQDHMSALQRMKSLTERNRMVLDKLSSRSRLSSPAPSKSSRSPFSPPATEDPSPTSSSRVSSSVRPRTSLSYASNSYLSTGNGSSAKQPTHDYSGSETEREPEPHREYGHHYSSSDSMSVTPTTTYSEVKPVVEETPSRSRFVRRRLSAPATPDKVLNASSSTITRDRFEQSSTTRERSRDPSSTQDRSRAPSRASSPGPLPGPSRTPRKRMSTLSVRGTHYDDGVEADRDDITSAALAAVASSRKSPRSRGTLPREFRENDRRSSDGKEPGTPSRNRARERERIQRRSPSPRSPRASTSNSNNPSPRKQGRPSTIRELTRRHQTRWLSEDLSAQDRDDTTSSVGRRQSHKTGSSESPLSLTTPGGRSLVGEGLRAAGLTRRKETNEDPFAGNGDSAVIPRRTKSSSSGQVAQGDHRYSVPAVPSYSRASERGPDPRTPAQRHERTSTYTGGTRPGTSMAALHSDEPQTAPPGIRTYRSSFAMERQPSSSSSQQASEASSGYDRGYSSRGNHTAPLPASAIGASSTRDPHAEHRRLMLDALGMFESQLSRLPPMGQTTTTTIPDVFQTSQHLVHTMDKLNGMLKSGTNQALEAQIDAEVSDSHDQSPTEIWTKVGMDYRENLRMSDEVVRTMTAFLLGISRVLRDANTSGSTHQQHLRTMSLDEDAVSKQRSSADGLSAGSLSIDRRSSDGRRSRETRRSWDPRDSSNTTLNLSRRLASRERSNGALSRPGSSMNQIRSSAASSEAKSNSGSSPREQTHQSTRNLPSTLLSSANRPFSTPKDQRVSSDPSRNTPSFDSPDHYEPSPTPAARNTSAYGRSRALPPLAIPPSLSTLPSESLLRQSATSAISTSTDKSSTRRKISSNSNITIKPELSTSSSFQPVIRPSNPTTAVTAHTVSHSPEVSTSSLPRNGYDHNSFTHTNGVVFSKPSSVSVSTLNGVQQRQRTISSNSIDEPLSAVSTISSLRSPMSGSETERPRTLGLRSRMSLDRGATPERSSTLSSASTLLSARRERRRTITEVFQA